MPLFVILLCFTFTLARSTGDVTDFVFNGFAGANLTVDDSATVTPDGVLVLTNGTYLMKGHGVYPSPLHFHSPPPSAVGGTVLSFSTTFVFVILSEYADFSSYGIAFFVAPTNDFTATLPSQYMGLFNTTDVGNATNHIFAVELDTVLDVEFGDIDSNHVGINIDGLRSLTAAPAAYYDDDAGSGGELRNMTLISGEAMQVWVDYDGTTTELNVTLAPLRVPKPKRPLLSHAVDLSNVITATSYVGFASSLGSMSSRHCILGWSLSLNNGSAPSLDYSKLPNPPVAANGNGWSKTVVEAVVPIAIVVAIAVVTGAFVFALRRVKYAELREEWEDEFGPRRFSYKDLYHATDGFADTHLLGVGGFGKRFRIIKDVALGLYYLHNSCEQVIVHRDVKASNVLLDDKMSGHLGEFGLARLHDHDANPRTTRLVGTIGYLTPELARTSKATPLTDVFAFGVFILEVTCGRRPIEEDEDEGGECVLLVDWVLRRWSEGRLGECVDVRLQGEYDAGEASLVLKLGMMCAHAAPGKRPTMAQCTDNSSVII
nr:unnamed protein product [Digitaria exilis]